MTFSFRWLVLLGAAAIALALLVVACAGGGVREGELDAASLPENERADYAVFAQRCSKCHSLARPLNSGIVDDDYWAMYVARMRRQPSSGISTEDSRVILRFLHYYSLDQRAKKEAQRATFEDAGAPPLSPSPLPLPPDAAFPDGGP